MFVSKITESSDIIKINHCTGFQCTNSHHLKKHIRSPEKNFFFFMCLSHIEHWKTLHAVGYEIRSCLKQCGKIWFNNYIHNNYILIQLKKDIRIKLLSKLFIKQKKIPDVVKGPVETTCWFDINIVLIRQRQNIEKMNVVWTCLFNLTSTDKTATLLWSVSNFLCVFERQIFEIAFISCP